MAKKPARSPTKKKSAAKRRSSPSLAVKSSRSKTKTSSKPRPAATINSVGGYSAYRDSQASLSRERSRTGREIGPLPEVKDQARRDACRDDLERFSLTYFPKRFPWPFSASHREAIGRIQTCTTLGGLFALAMPRGDGKTTIAEVAVLHAVLYGLRRFVVLLQATEPLAGKSLRKIQRELETNELLAEDFPEVCYPIAALERIHNRAKGQTLDDKPTRIEWTSNGVTLPTIDGSPSSGSILWVGGITGAVRGLSANSPDGGIIRPDLVVIDDAQTRESAKSLSQTNDRELVISGDVLGLAGPGTQIAAVALCTVIYPNDLSERLLDTERNPEWQGIRTKMLVSFPKRMELWDRYDEIRRQGIRDRDQGWAANEFYLANRAAMDEGAVASWPERMKTGEASAIQSAMNLYLKNPIVFAAEYQNEPEPIDIGAEDELDADAIVAKVNGCKRGEVPPDVTRLTMFVDVQAKVLFYAVCGWNEYFSGHIIDYGTHPPQNRPYFLAADPRPSLADLFPNHNEDARIFSGLKELIPLILNRGYRRQDGTDEMRIDRGFIDSGKWTKTVATYCRQSSHRDVIMPSKGWGIGSGKLPMATWTLKPGERRGDHWIMRPNTEGGYGRLVTIDVNYWKSFVAKALVTPVMGVGCLQLFGDKTDQLRHQLFAEHLTAEYRSGKHLATGDQGGQDLWALRPERRDNHWWDCVVGCAAAASFAGVKFSPATAAGEPPPPPKPKKPKRDLLAEFNALAAQNGGHRSFD